MGEFSAIGIKKIYYGAVLANVAVPYVDSDPVTGLSAAELKAFLANAATKQVGNVHQDTWNYEKAEADMTQYKNQLNKKTYRMDSTPGDSSIAFSIGKYDLVTKAAFEGGGADADKYSSPSEFSQIFKTIVALTEDGYYIVFPKAAINARGVTTDNAIALAVSATPMEPDIKVESEAWFSKTSVDAAVVTP